MIEDMAWLPNVVDNLASEFEPQYDLCEIEGEVNWLFVHTFVN